MSEPTKQAVAHKPWRFRCLTCRTDGTPFPRSAYTHKGTALNRHLEGFAWHFEQGHDTEIVSVDRMGVIAVAEKTGKDGKVGTVRADYVVPLAEATDLTLAADLLSTLYDCSPHVPANTKRIILVVEDAAGEITATSYGFDSLDDIDRVVTKGARVLADRLEPVPGNVKSTKLIDCLRELPPEMMVLDLSVVGKRDKTVGTIIANLRETHANEEGFEVRDEPSNYGKTTMKSVGVIGGTALYREYRMPNPPKPPRVLSDWDNS